jgi:hypothetical protein
MAGRRRGAKCGVGILMVLPNSGVLYVTFSSFCRLFLPAVLTALLKESGTASVDSGRRRPAFQSEDSG